MRAGKPPQRASFMDFEGVVHVAHYRKFADDYGVACFGGSTVSKDRVGQMTPTCLACVVWWL